MITDVIFAALEAWIRTVNPDIEVIEADPQAPRPCPPYVVLAVIAPASRDGLDDQKLNDDGTITVSGQRRVTFQVTYVGEYAVERLAEFRDRLDLPQVNGIFSAAGFSVPSDGDIIDLTETRENKFEDRAALDLIIQYAVNTTDRSTGYFEKTEVNQTLIGGNQNGD